MKKPGVGLALGDQMTGSVLHFWSSGVLTGMQKLSKFQCADVLLWAGVAPSGAQRIMSTIDRLFEFPGSPLVKTLRVHCQGTRFNPWWGN